MSNKGRQGHSKELGTLSNAWSIRRVVCRMKKDEIFAVTQRLSGGALPGDTAYMKEYQNGVTEVMTSLTEEDLTQFKDLAESWSKNGCTPEVQAQNWATKGQKFFQSVVKTAYQDFGMRVLICATIKDEDGVRMIHL